MNNNTYIRDLLAGLTVSFAALSLGAAFGSLSGRGAFAGMIGAAIIPIITSLLGGTRIQASGPTAPMTAVTAVVVAYAYQSFPDRALAEQFITLVILLCGVTQILSGVLRLGKLITYVPNAVVLGFMNGIAVLIWADQIAKLFGLTGRKQFAGGIGLNVLLMLATLAIIFTLPPLLKRLGVPAAARPFFSAILLSIVTVTAVASLLALPVEKVTLGNTVGSLGEFWQLLKSYFPTGAILQTEYLLTAARYALQLTLLGYLDSLLTALVIDRMTKEKTAQNKELIAQGVGNMAAGLLQGIPGAQATIRSVLLVNEGAQTRLAGALLGIFVFICLLFLKNFITLIPAAVFAGVLIKAGWDVCDRDYMRVYFKRGWYRSTARNFQFFLILYTTLVTVLFDLNIAVISGSILFYLVQRVFRAAELTDVEAEFEEEID